MSGGSIVPSYEVLGYACSRRSQQIRCRTVYFVDARTGRLAGFWTDSHGFRTDRGSRPGMREDVADRLEGAHPHVEALTGIYRATSAASLFVENARRESGCLAFASGRSAFHSTSPVAVLSAAAY